MHPAFSVIFLTTLIGVGQGMFLALFTGQSYAAVNLVPTQDSAGFYGLGAIIALVFLIGGLIASVFHLGRPERRGVDSSLGPVPVHSDESCAVLAGCVHGAADHDEPEP